MRISADVWRVSVADGRSWVAYGSDLSVCAQYGIERTPRAALKARLERIAPPRILFESELEAAQRDLRNNALEEVAVRDLLLELDVDGVA